MSYALDALKSFYNLVDTIVLGAVALLTKSSSCDREQHLKAKIINRITSYTLFLTIVTDSYGSTAFETLTLITIDAPPKLRVEWFFHYYK